MLNCQNISTFKKMLYCLFLFRLLNVRPGNASKFFKTSTRTSSLLYISAIAFFVPSLCVMTDGNLATVTHKYPSATNFTLLDQWDCKHFSIMKRYAKDFRLNVIPAGSFSISLPPYPFFLFLFSPIFAQMSLFTG